MASYIKSSFLNSIRGYSVLFILFMLVQPAFAAEPQFSPLLYSKSYCALLIQDDTIVCGLNGGGLIMRSVTDPEQSIHLVADKELSGNIVTDIAWSGSFVWVATHGGGLTRISNPGPDAEYRHFTSVLGGLEVTAVTGAIIGDIERVYYGIAGKGVGVITNGIAGAVYDVEQDDLISNDILALQLFEGDLFIATAVGISRFSDGVFSDQNLGLTDLYIDDMAISPDGELLAVGHGGMYRWDADSQTWERVSTFRAWLERISCNETETWVLGKDSSSNGVLAFWNGSSLEEVPSPNPKCASIVIGEDLWVGGGVVISGESVHHATTAYLSQRSASGEYDTRHLEGSLIQNPEGVTIGADGSLWIGSFSGNGVSTYDGQQWDHITELASADNDSSGLYSYGGNILSMATGSDGSIWFHQFGSGGVLHHDPVSGNTELIHPGNSPMLGKFILRIVAHPDGPVFFMHEGQDDTLVDILVDVEHWRNRNSWLQIMAGDLHFGDAVQVWDAAFERKDVVWFAVSGQGLVRWDVNGLAGPDEPVTWLDTSDDRWESPLATLPGVGTNLKLTWALEVDSSGAIWAGGEGVARFYFDEDRHLVVYESGNFSSLVNPRAWMDKPSTFVEGLVNSAVHDLVIDLNDDVWVASELGLNRLRVEGKNIYADAYFDLNNYYSNDVYGVLYSPNVITALPGRSYRRLAVDSAGKNLILSSNLGVTKITVAKSAVTSRESLENLVCYPNPFEPGEDNAQLKLAGFAADANSGDPAIVEIYNLEGELVFRDRQVSADTAFWNGKNRYQSLVATGMYLVKVTWQNKTATRTLAVVR